VAALHFLREGQPDGEGETAADDCIPAEQPLRSIEQMHRATSSVRAAFILAIHFSHEHAHVHAAYQCMGMFTIRRDDVVFGRERMKRAHCGCLFTDIQMQKAANLAGAVKLRAFFL